MTVLKKVKQQTTTILYFSPFTKNFPRLNQLPLSGFLNALQQTETEGIELQRTGHAASVLRLFLPLSLVFNGFTLQPAETSCIHNNMSVRLQTR